MSKSNYAKSKPKLNVRQEKFVDFFIQTGNVSKAAEWAGYTPKSAPQTGNDLLNNPKIQTAIQQRMKDIASERVADTKEIVEYLTAVMRGELDEEITLTVGTGKGFSQIAKTRSQIMAKDRLKAAEMLAKINGMFLAKAELEVSGTLPIVIQDDV